MSEDRHNKRLDETADMYLSDRSDESLQAVVLAAEPFVAYFCKLYGGSASKDDLYQAGMEGLLKALRDYDVSRGVTFSTYAGHKIMGEVRHWVRKEASYRRPGTIMNLQFKIDAFIDAWYKENGSMPTPEQVSESLGIRQEGIVEVMRAGLVSYDEIDQEAIHSTSYRSFELPIEDKLLLAQIYEGLSVMQRKLWHMLFEKHYTQEKAAQVLGLTQRQVSREKVKMLRSMKLEMQAISIQGSKL